MQGGGGGVFSGNSTPVCKLALGTLLGGGPSRFLWASLQPSLEHSVPPPPRSASPRQPLHCLLKEPDGVFPRQLPLVNCILEFPASDLIMSLQTRHRLNPKQQLLRRLVIYFNEELCIGMSNVQLNIIRHSNRVNVKFLMRGTPPLSGVTGDCEFRSCSKYFWHIARMVLCSNLKRSKKMFTAVYLGNKWIFAKKKKNTHSLTLEHM